MGSQNLDETPDNFLRLDEWFNLNILLTVSIIMKTHVYIIIYICILIITILCYTIITICILYCFFQTLYELSFRRNWASNRKSFAGSRRVKSNMKPGQTVDWFKGKFTGLSPIYYGNIYGFRLQFSHQNQSIEIGSIIQFYIFWWDSNHQHMGGLSLLYHYCSSYQ